MNTDDLITNESPEDDDDDALYSLIEGAISDYWEGQIEFDAGDLALLIIDTIESNGYEIKATLVD